MKINAKRREWANRETGLRAPDILVSLSLSFLLRKWKFGRAPYIDFPLYDRKARAFDNSDAKIGWGNEKETSTNGINIDVENRVRISV
jgi:hypothetical protein